MAAIRASSYRAAVLTDKAAKILAEMAGTDDYVVAKSFSEREGISYRSALRYIRYAWRRWRELGGSLNPEETREQHKAVFRQVAEEYAGDRATAAARVKCLENVAKIDGVYAPEKQKIDSNVKNSGFIALDVHGKITAPEIVKHRLTELLEKHGKK